MIGAMREAALVLGLSVLVAGAASACGGPPAPKAGEGLASGPKKAAATAEAADKGAEGKPAPTYKYPAPFMEPDCAVPQAEGYLPNAKQVVAEVRKAHWKQLEACAEAAPPGENVHGEVRTQFRLDPDGVPRCVEAPGASITQVDVVRCVISVYRTFRFPPPKNGSVRVTDGIQLDVSHEDE